MTKFSAVAVRVLSFSVVLLVPSEGRAGEKKNTTEVKKDSKGMESRKRGGPSLRTAA